MARWTAADIPSQQGRVAIVTGATSGLGLEAARQLARAGARVVVAGRNPQKGAAAVDAIRSESPGAAVEFAEIDLGSLGSVRAFAEEMSALPRLDILLNNAGLMMMPDRQETAEGFERQFGTNHLGHFVLTAALWPFLAATAGSRVVTVASNAHRRGRIRLDDPNFRSGYAPMVAYSQSKLANLIFAIELHRRIAAAHLPVSSIAAHPGLTHTNLFVTGQQSGREAAPPGWRTRIGNRVIGIIGMTAQKGTLPLLYAATAPEAASGAYYGPDGPGGWRGWPAVAKPIAAALDEETARRLWTLSEELTGTRFDVAA
ncbi:MAG: SDR family oxidoreductase [Bauldia sp.]|nr:SDR family oxidoreductase [Bauldia sp.]